MLLSYGIRREAVLAGREDVLGRIRGRQSERWQLHDTIEMMRRGGWQAPPPPPPARPPAPTAPTAAAQLSALAALRRQGGLTDEEFSARKARILDG
jgi:hypothetical protein